METPPSQYQLNLLQSAEDAKTVLEFDTETSVKCGIVAATADDENMVGIGQYLYAHVGASNDSVDSNAETLFEIQ